MSEVKNGGLDQYGAKPFERQQIGTAGIEGVNCIEKFTHLHWKSAPITDDSSELNDSLHP